MSIQDDEWKTLGSALNGYVLSDSLAAGCELGLFTFLEKNPGSSLAAIAAGIGAPEHGVRALLLGCSTAGLIRRDPTTHGYLNSSVASKVLVEGTPDCFTSFVRFVHQVQKRGSWSLARSVKEGRNAGLDDIPGEGRTLYDRIEGNPKMESLFHEAMGAFSRLAPKVVDLAEVAKATRLLDVGGGNGSVAAALCARNDGLRVTILDKPTVCAIAEQSLARTGMDKRISCYPCNIFADPWPSGHDAVLLSHMVEIFSVDKVKALYKSAFGALPAGGQCIVWTNVSSDDEDGGLQAAKVSTYFLSMASGEGLAYPVREHREWLTAAGFSSVTAHVFRAFDHAAIIATR